MGFEMPERSPKMPLKIGDYIFMHIRWGDVQPWHKTALDSLVRALNSGNERLWLNSATIFGKILKKEEDKPILELFVMFLSDANPPFKELVYKELIYNLNYYNKTLANTTMGLLIAHESDEDMVDRLSKYMNIRCDVPLFAHSRPPLSAYHKDNVIKQND